MPRVFLANLGFERELSHTAGTDISGPARIRRDDLACVWVGMASANDVIVVPGSVDPAFRDDLARSGLCSASMESMIALVPGSGTQFSSALVPWGWTESVRQLAKRSGLVVDAPPQSLVCDVNARDFSLRIEHEFGLGPASSRHVRSVAEIEHALRCDFTAERHWCLKSRFGCAGRGMLRGCGARLKKGQRAWSERQLLRDGVVFLEPWLDRISEAGILFEIHRDGEIRHEGVAELLCSPAGGYRGSLFAAGDQIESQWSDAVAVCIRIAQRVRDTGYFGPLGIDAMRYRDNGRVQLRAGQDINARYTMGRMALGFRSMLQPDEFGLWLHVNWQSDGEEPDEWFASRHRRFAPDVRAVRTSPYTIGGRVTQTGSILLISTSRDALDFARSARIPSGHDS